jgi:hypothetical protein
MNTAVSTFEEDGVIRVQGFLGREAIKRHGAKVITCPTASLMRNDLLNTACRVRIEERKGYKDAQNGANGTRNRGRCATQS